MRGKRSKQYRKLMQQYGLNYGFRTPYQVLVDSEIIRDADKFKMDLHAGLERTLQGEVKIMITQCSIRHLYAANTEPGVSFLIDKAKTYERRRCGHLPEDYPEPLSTRECLAAVIDPKGSKTNKHRYVVASQDQEARRDMRSILGVPLVYINRSVMVMEPMADASTGNREREERGKLREGLKRGSGSMKRKREEGDDDPEASATPKKTKRRGPKEPNPLSVKKSKKTKVEGIDAKVKGEEAEKVAGFATEESESSGKRKRKRKQKVSTAGASAEEGSGKEE